MTDKTEQRILDAALKIFAKEGYKGATTRAMADEAGFNELTLFRKFKNKENLYNTVLTKNVEKMLKDYEESVFIDKKFENPRDFLETYIKNTLKAMTNNFEVFYLAINEENKVLEPMMDETIHFIGKYFEKNIPGKKIDYETFGFTINSFIYVINLEKYHGRTSSFGKSSEETVENAIDIFYCMINH
jgi:AcrR family transcriptional regulator